MLTVRAHNANSHKDRGWEKFTDAVISHLNKNLHGIVFILWGSYAQKKGSQIDKVNSQITFCPVFFVMLSVFILCMNACDVFAYCALVC